MALKNKKQNDSEFKYQVSKQYLSDAEMIAFISCVVDDIVNANEEVPYYANKKIVINTYTVGLYLGDSVTEIETDHYYDVVRDILKQIDLDQYYDMLEAVDDGIRYELSKQISVFGDANSMSNEDSIKELSDLVDKIGVDKIDKVLQMGVETEAVKNAMKEVKQKSK